jgi:hypothetical protein
MTGLSKRTQLLARSFGAVRGSIGPPRWSRAVARDWSARSIAVDVQNQSHRYLIPEAEDAGVPDHHREDLTNPQGLISTIYDHIKVETAHVASRTFQLWLQLRKTFHPIQKNRLNFVFHRVRPDCQVEKSFLVSFA